MCSILMVPQKSFVTGKDHVQDVERLSRKIVGTKSPWTVILFICFISKVDQCVLGRLLHMNLSVLVANRGEGMSFEINDDDDDDKDQ